MSRAVLELPEKTFKELDGLLESDKLRLQAGVYKVIGKYELRTTCSFSVHS